MKYLLPLLVLLAVDHVRANLGETPAQLQDRYGQPVFVTTTNAPEKGEVVRHYRTKELLVIVVFIDNKSECEEYDSQKRHFTNADIQKLLDDNSMGSKWLVQQQTQDHHGWQPWKLENGRAYADLVSTGVKVKTAEYQAADEAFQETLKQAEDAWIHNHLGQGPMD